MERTTIWLSEEDKAIYAEVQALYGCESFSHAIRLAGRVALQTGKLNLALPPTSKYGKTKPKHLDKGTTGGVFAELLQLAEEVKLESLPEDFAERLDDYLYSEFRDQAA